MDIALILDVPEECAARHRHALARRPIIQWALTVAFVGLL